jgi:hypothetical protein
MKKRKLGYFIRLTDDTSKWFSPGFAGQSHTFANICGTVSPSACVVCLYRIEVDDFTDPKCGLQGLTDVGSAATHRG